jgi:type I restriction enzyme S subunit
MVATPEALFENLFSAPLRNGLTRPKAVRGQGIPMINMGEIFSHGRIGDIPMDRVQLGEKEANFLLEPGDLLFARQSLVFSGAGKCSIFVGASEPVTFESHLIRARLNIEAADPRFYYYFFGSPTGRFLIETIVEQVAAAGIRGSDLKRLHVPVPPLREQQGVADLLGALDDKIELNRRIAELVEVLGLEV